MLGKNELYYNLLILLFLWIISDSDLYNESLNFKRTHNIYICPDTEIYQCITDM